MNARNPQYNANGSIDLEINHPKLGWILFTASSNDTEQFGKDIYNLAIAGEFGEIAEFVEVVLPDPPVLIPSRVSMRQARLALLSAGLLSQVNAAIDALPSPDKEAAQIQWEYSQEVNRNEPLVTHLANALNLTEAQLDDLFLKASTL